MQNQVVTGLAAALLSVSCMQVGTPYEGDIHALTVKAVYPGEYSAHAGADISITNLSSEVTYALQTDAQGCVSTHVSNGIYRVSVSDRVGNHLFNGTVDKVVVSGRDASLEVELLHSVAGLLVIKELYCGGCPKEPEEGTYQSDQYVMVHNNDAVTTYLDGLCLGTLSPYNSNAANPWADADGNLPDFAPVIQAVWMIGGNGSSFPLEAGADAVICLRGAIDHAAQYPLSVNLNKADYFVCYNPAYFPNPVYHPAPGDQIQPERYLEVVIKTGQANAYTVSVNSPAFILFRPEEGVDIHEFVSRPESLVQVPGSSVDRVIAVPLDWITDAVEVFNGGSSNNRKRLSPSVDAGYVTLSESFKGHTLMRKADEEASAQKGFEVLQDSNNSSLDFYEREVQSLHQ